MSEPFQVELKGGPLDGQRWAYPKPRFEVRFKAHPSIPGDRFLKPHEDVYRNSGKWSNGRRVFNYIGRWPCVEVPR